MTPHTTAASLSVAARSELRWLSIDLLIGQHVPEVAPKQELHALGLIEYHGPWRGWKPTEAGRTVVAELEKERG